MDKHALLKSYCQPDEKLLLAKVLDQADLSLRNHSLFYTDFLDPSMCAKACDVLRFVRDLKFIPFGGYEDAERQMIALCPDYFSNEDIVFPVDVIKITHNTKFSVSLSHRDYLGSVLGMGIERSKIGDILVFDDATYCFADSSISSYIISNLERVGHTKVRTELVNLDTLIIPEKKMDIKNVTVSSLRADTVFGAVFGKSRSDMQELIRAEKAAVNWTPINSVSSAINEGDILSLKGSGRGKLIEVGGTTKKGRLVITVGRYV